MAKKSPASAILFLQQLAHIFPATHFSVRPKDLKHYAQDQYHSSPLLPLAIVWPQHAEEIQQLLQLATQTATPLFVRGGGTGACGGALPSVANGVVISLEKMNRILEVDLANQMAVVEPGVITGHLQAYVEKRGLFYPPDPSSLAECTIGGNVAVNAGGPRALKYGVTRDYVLGLEGFWASGSPFVLGGKHYKNVAGYNLKDLLIGSEGTLAILTKIYLKLLPKPAYRRTMAIEFADFAPALQLLQEIRQLDNAVCAAEFLDNRCLQAVATYLQQPAIALDNGPCSIPIARLRTTQALLILEIEAFSAQALASLLPTITTLLQKRSCGRITSAGTPAARARLWALRRLVSPALKHVYQAKVSHDIVVPPNQISHFLQELHRLPCPPGISLLGYGHLGDGNIHVNILKQAADPQVWPAAQTQLSQAILQLAVRLGGTITGEHGIGWTKTAYLPLVYPPTTLQIMRDLKNLFDPQNLLNPDKAC